MDATALSRPAHRTSRQDVSAGEVGLCFERPGGPLVALCGLVGGAGTSTLSWLLARQAARESAAAVLLCEHEALAGGLAVLAGRASRRGLTELGELVEHADDAPADASFAALAGGLRLLATLPRPIRRTSPSVTGRVLTDARAAHGLVVLDARTLDHPDAAAALRLATHIAWVLPASAAALAQAQVVLASRALPVPGRAREALVAVATQSAACAPVRDLRHLAQQRAERLILVPHIPELPQAHEPAGEAAAAALAQLATFLRRPP